MEDFICHISKIFFPDVGGYSLDSHHGFVVEYGMDRDVELGFHVDDSEVTLNVCLGKQFTGGELFFRGVRCEKHVNSETHPEEFFYYSHAPARAIIHRGRHRHGARATTSEHRINLLLWCRRYETGATIKVDSSKAEEEADCIISISAKEVFEDTFSPAIEAALRLQPKCSERVERDSGGAIITEIRRNSKANRRILSKEQLAKVGKDDDEMVQISAELDLSKDALLQVTSRLRANLFEKEGAMSTFVPVLPYLPERTRLTFIINERRPNKRSQEAYL